MASDRKSIGTCEICAEEGVNSLGYFRRKIWDPRKGKIRDGVVMCRSHSNRVTYSKSKNDAAGIDRPGSPYPWYERLTDDERDEVRRLYDDGKGGWTMRQLAEHFGVATMTIQRIIVDK